GAGARGSLPGTPADRGIGVLDAHHRARIQIVLARLIAQVVERHLAALVAREAERRPPEQGLVQDLVRRTVHVWGSGGATRPYDINAVSPASVDRLVGSARKSVSGKSEIRSRRCVGSGLRSSAPSPAAPRRVS